MTSFYSLVSGAAVNASICDGLISLEATGKDRMNNFIKRLSMEGSSESFSDPIKRFPMKNFEDSFVKGKLSKRMVNRAKFVSRGISWENWFHYPVKKCCH